MPTRHRAQQHTYLGQKYEKPGNQVPYILDFEKNLKDAHKSSVKIGCDTLSNKLMRFLIEAKPT